MSPIGRIFIVLNLILAVLFLGWSATHLATAQDYKTQLDDLQSKYDTDLEAKDEEISQLKVQQGNLETSLSSTRTEKEGLEGEKTRLETDLTGERQKNASLGSSVTEIQGTLGQYATAIDNLRQENSQLVEQRQAADEARHTAENEREDALEQARDAQEQLAAANNRIAELETETTSLAKSVSNLETQLSVAIESTGFDPKAAIVMPVIDGAVLNVSYDLQPGLVAINKGSNDGVQRGFTFDIFRGGQYKGQVKVENVQGNMCTCVIVKTWEGRTIAQGDNATTRI